MSKSIAFAFKSSLAVTPRKCAQSFRLRSARLQIDFLRIQHVILAQESRRLTLRGVFACRQPPTRINALNDLLLIALVVYYEISS